MAQPKKFMFAEPGIPSSVKCKTYNAEMIARESKPLLEYKFYTVDNSKMNSLEKLSFARVTDLVNVNFYEQSPVFKPVIKSTTASLVRYVTSLLQD